jgi:hypothetical protein
MSPFRYIENTDISKYSRFQEAGASSQAGDPTVETGFQERELLPSD